MGFAWHPDTDALYFTDNGRDAIGGSNASYTDTHPDDELNLLADEALPAFFGFPYCHTGAVGGGDATPCQRAAGVGDPIPDPKFNQDEQVYSCNGEGEGGLPEVGGGMDGGEMGGGSYGGGRRGGKWCCTCAILVMGAPKPQQCFLLATASEEPRGRAEVWAAARLTLGPPVLPCPAVAEDDYVPAVQALGPHLAALGITFYE